MFPQTFFSENNLMINNIPFYICGGEIQYFRLPKALWQERLKQAAEGGLNTVSSYIPWYFHEYEEGEFDFDGKTMPERDIRGFLRLAQEAGLKVVARPGPYINSELRFGGLPEWLCRNHPEVLSHRAEGCTVRGTACPAEGETVYRNYVRKWFEQIVPLIAEFQISRGGPVIMFQPDNELSAAWSFGLFNSLYDPETIGIRWPEWLADKYGTIDALSSSYSNTYTGFEDIEPPRTFPVNRASKLLAMDWLDFKRHIFADWGSVMCEWAQELGIEVPFVFNEPVAGFYGHGDHSGFGAAMKNKGFQAVMACHTYSDRILDLDGVQNMLLGIKLVKASPLNGPALSLESNSLWYVPRLSRIELNWNILLRFGLGHGLNGNIIYPYTEEIVDLKDVIEGPEYFEPGCIGIDGKLGQPYHIVGDFFNFVKAWEQEICTTDTKPELAIAYTAGIRYLDFLGAPTLTPLYGNSGSASRPGGDKFDAEPAIDRGDMGAGHDWTDGYEGVSKQTVKPESGIWRKFKEAMLLCSRLNISCEAYDLINSEKAPDSGVLVVPNTGCLEKEAVDRLVKFLETGGTCIFTPAVPMFTLDGQRDSRLLELLGLQEPELIRPAGGVSLDYGSRVVKAGGLNEFGVHSWLFHYPLRNEENTAVIASWQGKALARVINAAKGKAVIVGFDPSYTSKGTLNFWDMIFKKYCGAKAAVDVRGNFYNAVLRQGDDFNILTTMNIGGSFGTATVKINKLPEFELELHPLEGRILVINAECAGNRIVYTTSELTPLDPERSAFKVSGQQGTKGETAFAGPTEVILGENRYTTTAHNGVHIISYVHQPQLKMMISAYKDL